MAAYAESTDDIRDLYRELILDHAKSPRNFGRLDVSTHTAEGVNPLCGDKLKLYLHVTNDRIDDVSFEGSGCAISLASASMMTDIVRGLTTPRAREYFDAVRANLTSDMKDAPNIDLGKLRALDGVREFPTRIKCATLAWHALDSALRGRSSPVSTE